MHTCPFRGEVLAAGRYVDATLFGDFTVLGFLRAYGALGLEAERERVRKTLWDVLSDEHGGIWGGSLRSILLTASVPPVDAPMRSK